MAVTATPVFVQTPNIAGVQIVNADGSNQKNVMRGGANGSKVLALNLASSDTSDRVVQIYINRVGGTSFLLCTANVAANAGIDATVPAVDAFSSIKAPGIPVDQDGQHFLFLTVNDQLNVRSTTALTATKNVDCTCVFADF
jgi:hypothetical protein